ncbi:MAG: hypothetical protein RL207_498 [Bacteroidota bacterium]|jgi:hypothetical protein
MKVWTAFLLIAFFSCTKEVNIDIPNYQNQLVVDGIIETGGNPIVLLSQSANIYETSDLAAYLSRFVYDAQLNVISGNDTFPLSLFTISELPIDSQKKVAEMLRLDWNEALLLPIKVYSSTDLIAQANMSYTLEIKHLGKSFKGTTHLPNPTPLDSIYWKPESGNVQYGYSWARLSDPANQFDGYKWEVKRINLTANGDELDNIYKRGYGGFFSDQFFDGQTIEFYFENPLKRKDTTHLKEFKRMYRIGDTVVVKFSKMDQQVFSFYDKKYAQLNSASSPFSTPINVPSNIPGLLGVWAGFSPCYDTLYCVE